MSQNESIKQEKPAEVEASELPDLLCCSFCGTDKSMATAIIAGPGVNICAACVHKCMGILLGLIKKTTT